MQKLFSGFRQSVEQPSVMVVRRESANAASDTQEPLEKDFTNVQELLEEYSFLGTGQSASKSNSSCIRNDLSYTLMTPNTL